MTEPNKPQREIAIFWDYENVPLPDWCSATQAAKAIVDAVSPYGRIVDRRLYYDFEKMRYRPRDCSSLDSSGFDLVNTPTRNNKETLDKKLIADVLTFAWDSAVRNDNSKPCVVLLTGDGDYAYTISKLRDRGIMTFVMVGKDCTVASILVDTADVAMSLEDDILRDVEKSSTPSSSKSTRAPSPRTSTGSTRANNGQDPAMLSICRHVKTLTAKSEDEWTDFGQVAVHIQQAVRSKMPNVSPEMIKEKAREARQQAESSGYIEIGRRKLDTKGDKREIIASNDRKLKLSPEVYVRLLPKGEQLLRDDGSARHQQGTATSPKPKKPPTSPFTYSDDDTSKTSPQKRPQILYLPRFPNGVHVQDVVNFLETTFDVSVRRARMESSSTSSFYHAHVEFCDEKDVQLVLQAANKAAGGKGIYYEGKSIGAMPNTRGKSAFSAKGSENLYYESEELKAPPSQSPNKVNKSVTQDDTSADTQKFCLAVYLTESSPSEQADAGNGNAWVESGAVGMCFRSQLRPAFLRAATKEECSSRYKKARNKAIQDGLAETGRRQLDNDGGIIAVALDDAGTRGGKLSLNTYLRLLPPGQSLAIEAQRESPQKSPERSKFIFINNLPSGTTATQLAQHLETLECRVQRIEFEVKTFKGLSIVAAHVECVDKGDAATILRKSKSHGGLVYCGRTIQAFSDRLSPEQLNSLNNTTSNPETSYIREETPVTTPSALHVDSMDNSVPSDNNTGSEEPQQEDLLDSAKLIMRQDSVTSDPFEDLISFT